MKLKREQIIENQKRKFLSFFIKMKCYKKNFLLLTLLLAVFFLFSAGCLSRMRMKEDPFYDTFFEKGSLIMTEEEVEIYKQLPDEQSKKEFIEEFWKIRDPDPSTEENECRIIFEERIEYANKWFGVRDPYKGRDRYEYHARSRGWNTDRGRIYIILGPPDNLSFDGEMIFGGRNISRPEAKLEEEWYYYQYQLRVQFTKTLVNLSAELLTSIESAKLNMVAPGYRDDIKRRLKFEAAFKDNHIHISIPVTRISFKERGDKLYSKFKIKMNVFLDHKQIDSIEETKSLNKSEEQLSETEEFLFKIPYEPKLKGKYVFDIMVEDLIAILSSKYRRFVHYKMKI